MLALRINRHFLVKIVVASVATWACMTTGAVAEEPAKESSEFKQLVKVDRNVRFSTAEGKAGLCDVYLPFAVDPPKAGYPVVLLVHGGGWITGDKWNLIAYANLLAANGFVAVAINYRLAPQHKFPAQVDDVRDGLLWLSKNSNRLSIDMDRLGLFGYSAGGHLATIISGVANEKMEQQLQTSRWAKDDKRWKTLPTIKAVSVGGPPCDFRDFPIDSIGMTFFLPGTRRRMPKIYDAASPTVHASTGDPVTQIIHGTDDALVPIASSRKLHKALKEADVDVRFVEMEKHGHMSTFLHSTTREKMLGFFKETL